MSIIDGPEGKDEVVEYLYQQEKTRSLKTSVLVGGVSRSVWTRLKAVDGALDRYVKIQVRDLPSISIHASDLIKILRRMDYRIEDRRNPEPLY